MSFQTFIASLGTPKRQTHVQIKERIEQLNIHLWIENVVTVREGKHYRVLELSAVSKQWQWTAQHFTAGECLHLLESQDAAISGGLAFIYGSAFAAPSVPALPPFSKLPNTKAFNKHFGLFK